MTTDTNQTVPMRDGVTLMADIVRPDADGRFPALIAASPYPRQIQNSGIPAGFVEAGASDFFVPRGYVHVLANMRGTGGSGGDYDFFGPIDRTDMYDLVEWASAQPWCDGNVGMIGISAFAMVQLGAAVEQPPHLRAIFPVAQTADLYDAAYPGGLLNVTFVGGWLKSLGTFNQISDKALRGSLIGIVERVLKQPVIHSRLEHFNGEAALSLLGRFMPARYNPHPWDDLLVNVALDHQTKDDFWRERDVLPVLGQVSVPVYLGCDWANVPLHLPSTFTALAALPETNPVRVALMEPGGLSWPWESLHVEALAWFDQWLKGRETGILDGPRIRYCMPGASDGWRACGDWPPVGCLQVALQLASDGTLTSGEAAAGGRDYFHLPGVSVPEHRGQPGPAASLVWETQPLPRAVEMAGAAELVLEATATAMDTSWIATLQDVGPDGDVIDVTAGWLRAGLRAVDESRSGAGSPSHPYDHLEPLTPGAPVTYRIPLVDNARRFGIGHRIRLVLASDDAKGPAVMGFHHSSIGLPSRNTVRAGSRLLLPIIDGSEALTATT